MNTKKIGIVGGVGWQSTVDYYSELCRRSERWHLRRNPEAVPSTPEISIESLDLNKAVSYLGSVSYPGKDKDIDNDDEDDEKSWSQFDEYHRAALQRLEASGADFALIASNSAHHRFASIVRGIRIPVISILEAMAKESARIGACEVLILGTALTMRSQPFREAFAKYGIEAAAPEDEMLRAATAGLIADLQLGKPQGVAGRLRSIARTSFEQQFGAQPVVCLACTELPLAFPEQKTLATFEREGVVYLNSSAAHINAAFDLAVGQASE
jgi:aspartate racemase